MNRRKLPHVVAVGVLAALLALPGPALAQGGHSRVPGNLLSWLAGLWDGGIFFLGNEARAVQKEGHGIDPNGGKPTEGAPSGGTTTGLIRPDGTEFGLYGNG